ncbi:MAG: FtsW/RodA/SpoVE family cell cycle protein [Clostridia bacterium]
MNSKLASRFVKETDKLLVAICMALSTFGIIMVNSATRLSVTDGSNLSRDALVMILAVGLGFVAAFIISIIDYDIILRLAPLVAVVSVGLMVGLLFFGVSPAGRDDAISWYAITSSLYFQPSEIVKIGFVITFAYHLSKIKDDVSSFKNVLFLCIHGAVPIGLVVLTGDMGSALVFICMFVGMMYVAGIHFSYFIAGALAVVASLPIIWLKVFSSIQRDRILALFNPDDYPETIYQQQQAINAIKSGGFYGTGVFNGVYTQSGLVPESENDMIFSVVCEETGFLGAVILIVLFMCLILRTRSIAKRSNNLAAQIMCYGVAFMFASQAIVNIGMCTMLLPVIGITLPFMSAGGSSNVCIYFAIGLLLSIYRSSNGIGYEDYRHTRIAKSL